MTDNSSPTDQQTIVLIPAYQPGIALQDTTSQLIMAGCVLVVVDDGSGQDYREVFNDLGKQVHIIRHGRNKGKGAALKTGFRFIQDSFDDYIVVTADADGQHAVPDILALAQAYQEHPGTLLLGARSFSSDQVPLRSRFGNELTRKIFSLLTKQKLRDTQTGLRAFDDSLTSRMIAVPGDGFEYEINVLLACSSRHIPIIELPIQTIYEPGNQSSHFNPIKDSWAIYKQFISFVSSSLLAFAVDYGLFIILLHLTSSWGLAASITFANTVSRLSSASLNFTINKNLIFKQQGNVAKGALAYGLLAGGILLGNTLLLNVLTSNLHISPYTAKFMTEISFFCVSYAVQKYLIFSLKESYQS